MTTVAGTAGQTGSADGVGAAARFSRPQGVASAGTTLYVTDSGNSTVRALDLGTALVTTFAGAAGQTGSIDGTRAAARFAAIRDITTDGTNLYVTDGSTIRVLSLTNDQVATLAGTAGVRGNADGVGTAAQFNAPTGITNDGSSLYVLDSQTIRRVVIATGEVTTVAGQPGWTGAEDGSWPRTSILGPQGIVFAHILQTLFIGDTVNNSIRQAVCGADNPSAVNVAPQGNPNGPVTGVDYLELSWAPQFAGLIPTATSGRSTAIRSPRPPRLPRPRRRAAATTRSHSTSAHAPAIRKSPAMPADSTTYSPAPPVASFSVGPAPGTTFTFTDTSTPQATSWLWLFGDGGFDTTQSVTHTYSSAGIYTVSLVATTARARTARARTSEPAPPASPSPEPRP